MPIVTNVIWWAGIALESSILLRSLRHKLFAKFPLFYWYITSVLIFDVAMRLVASRNHSAYEHWYWIGQLATLIIGYGVMLEILRKTFAPYPGAEKFGSVLIIGIFAVIFLFVAIQSLLAPDWTPASTTVELERDLRGVQALVLTSFLVIISLYGIRLGRNVKGLVFGYGLYIATSLVSLAVTAYAASRFEQVWNVLQPLSYLVSLMIWTAAMWAYSPNPAPQTPVRLESDYQSLVLKTREMLDSIRSRMERAAHQ
jgi:hypothetical protein